MVSNAVVKKAITAEQYKKIRRGLQQVRITGIFTLDRAEARKGQHYVSQQRIYIKHYAEVKKYAGDIGVQLDKFDNAHGLKHSAGAYLCRRFVDRVRRCML